MYLAHYEFAGNDHVILSIWVSAISTLIWI